jgi:hypothetical protein
MPRDDADLGSRADPLSGAPGVVWLSLDPVRRKVDFYPLPIAQRIEASLSAGEEHCVLGICLPDGRAHRTQPLIGRARCRRR